LGPSGLGPPAKGSTDEVARVTCGCAIVIDGHVILEGCPSPEGVGVDPMGSLLGVWTASPMGPVGRDWNQSMRLNRSEKS